MKWTCLNHTESQIWSFLVGAPVEVTLTEVEGLRTPRLVITLSEHVLTEATGFTARFVSEEAGVAQIALFDGALRVDQFAISLVTGRVVFSRAPTEDAQGNQYGYDEMDTPEDPTDDHVSVKKNDFTYIHVKLLGVLDASNIVFHSTDETVVTVEVPTLTPASGFLVKLLGQDNDKAEAQVEARRGSSAGPVAVTIFVNVYREIPLSAYPNRPACL